MPYAYSGSGPVMYTLVVCVYKPETSSGDSLHLELCNSVIS